MIIWLASYPKSGNTWLRSILSKILYLNEDFILKKIEERLAAKQKGDYKLADQIRDELLNKDVIIEDQKGKTTWKFK